MDNQKQKKKKSVMDTLVRHYGTGADRTVTGVCGIYVSGTEERLHAG